MKAADISVIFSIDPYRLPGEEGEEVSDEDSTNPGNSLRYSNFKEADRIYYLTPDRGKIQVLARGCRRQKSRFLSASEVLVIVNICYLNIGIYI